MLKPLWERVRGSLDTVVFVAVVLWVVGLTFYLLYPRPQLTVHLEPIPERSLQLASIQPFPAGGFDGEEAEVKDTPPDLKGSNSAHSHKRAGRKHGKKAHKPKAIPIVNINTATAPQLEDLPGVGPKMALRILAYRKGVGRFQDVEELRGVKGIGPKVLAKMKPYIRL